MAKPPAPPGCIPRREQPPAGERTQPAKTSTGRAMTSRSPALNDARDALLYQGWAVLDGVLDEAACAAAFDRLWAAAASYEAQGKSTFMPLLDPNAANVRVFNLLAIDACFRDLILQADATTLVEALSGLIFGFRTSRRTLPVLAPVPWPYIRTRPWWCPSPGRTLGRQHHLVPNGCHLRKRRHALCTRQPTSANPQGPWFKPRGTPRAL